ncbi:MAG: tetratricopeptide repeat protein, partial [Burkholderiales bacterium]
QKHGLDDIAREAKLRRAERALERRAFEETVSILDDATTAAQAADDYWRLGRAHVLRGYVHLRQSAFPDAAESLTTALRTLKRARASRDPARVEALIGLGSALSYMGREREALSRFEEASQSQVAQRSPKLRGRALWGLGWTHRKLGNLELAHEHLRQAKDALEAAEDLPDMIRVLHNLGQVSFEAGRPKEALRTFERALSVMEELGSTADRAAILTEIGRVQLHLGNHNNAAAVLRDAIDAATEAGDPVEAAEAGLLLARVHVLRHHTKTALPLVDASLATFRAHGMKDKAVAAAREWGLLLKEHGAHAKAAEFLALAMEHLPAAQSS